MEVFQVYRKTCLVLRYLLRFFFTLYSHVFFQLSISAPHWLVNKSGLPLVFRQDDCSHESAGQFEEHELARSVTPLLFSFTEKELPYLYV